METKHEGYTIKYNEDREEFDTEVDGAVLKSKSLKALKKKIDNISKPKFERVPVWFYSWHRRKSFESGFITSIAKNDHGPWEVWTIDSRKQRSKRRASNCYIDTNHNDKVMEEIVKINGAIVKLQDKKEAAIKSLQYYKVLKAK